MKSDYIEILDWDTNFFGFKVAKLNLEISKSTNLKEIIFQLDKKHVRLAYYSSLKRFPEQFNLISHVDIKLVDKKVTYMKKEIMKSDYHDSITIYDKDYPESNMLNIAIQSGEYSRFNIDKEIGKDKYEELYKLWLINSVKKEIAKEVLVFSDNGEIRGLVTLGEKKGNADIGIIAVESTNRGKGIGKSLMYAAETWFVDNGYSSIQVVTQEDNLSACNLYRSCGYELEKVEYFYHFWINSSKDRYSNM